MNVDVHNGIGDIESVYATNDVGKHKNNNDRKHRRQHIEYTQAKADEPGSHEHTRTHCYFC